MWSTRIRKSKRQRGFGIGKKISVRGFRRRSKSIYMGQQEADKIRLL